MTENIQFEVKNRNTGDTQFIAEIDCEEKESKGTKLRHAILWALKNHANLKGADLRGADLQEANLRWADLQEASLQEANLRWASLKGADLTGADLDFSCLPLWCGSLKAHMDDKQIKQLLYHVLSIVKHSNNVSDGMKKALLTKKLLKIANKSHVVSKHNCEEL